MEKELLKALEYRNRQFGQAIEMGEILGKEILRLQREVEFQKDLNRILKNQIVRLLAIVPHGITFKNATNANAATNQPQP